MSLSLQSRRVGGIIVIKCAGRIVEGAESAALQEQIKNLLPDDPYIILDLSEIDFVDSSGLGLLVRVLSWTHAVRGDIKLCAVPPRVSEILKITRLKTIFDSHESESDAIAAFYQRAKATGESDRLATDVLCVATSADVLAYVAEVLRQAGYGVMTADNLPDALMLLKGARPTLVVIGAELRSARGTWAADTFNELADKHSVIELPADFSSSDAGDAGARLLDSVRAGIGGRGQG